MNGTGIYKTEARGEAVSIPYYYAMIPLEGLFVTFNESITLLEGITVILTDAETNTIRAGIADELENIL